MDSSKPRATGNPTKGRKFSLKLKITLLLALLAVVIGGIVWGAIWLKRQMFDANPRFKLTRIEIKSQAGGFWSAPRREQRLWRLLKLSYGQSMFQIDLRNARSQLLAVASIKDAEVNLIYPDTLRCELLERIPRAFLKSPNSRLVIDDELVVISQAETNAPKNLPVIDFRVSRAIRPGDKLPELQAAMTLIMAVEQNYRNLDLFYIRVIPHPNPSLVYLETSLSYNGEKCIALFPVSFERREYLKKLIAFVNAIDRDSRNQGRVSRKFDLRFNDQVVISH